MNHLVEKFKNSRAKTNCKQSLVAGIGATISIGLLLILGQWFEHALLMAPFGASCVLLFSVPNSPLSQPLNVIAGHIVSTVIGLLCVYTLSESNEFIPLYIALAVGLSISAMALLGITHPPAGADPIVVILSQQTIGFLVFPVLIGAVLLVLMAMLHHRIFNLSIYPTNQLTTQTK